MPITPEDRLEEVFEGKGASIHVAPEGLAVSHRGAVATDPGAAVVEYGQVAGASVSGGSKPALVVQFTDGRRTWTIPGMRRSHAEWAKLAIDRQIRATRMRSYPLYSERLSMDDFAAQLSGLLQQAPLHTPDVVDAVLVQAALHNASDVHFLPKAHGLAVRWRVDGILRDIYQFDRSLAERVVARLKVVAGLASYDHGSIQEGRADLPLGRDVELRFTVLPTLHGETVTVRIFDPHRGIIPLDSLGMAEEDLALFRRTIAQPDGMVVLTGPAGAGKTTTMYAALFDLNETSEHAKSFATVEEPVEYDLPFASQAAASQGGRITFAEALRAVLRQDPNVLMIGEVRDPATAEIAVRAGMTGHLILTTLHTSSGGGVFPRLAEMDVAPFLATSAVKCIVSQRLVRLLCGCAQVGEPDAEALSILGLTAADVAGWGIKNPVGCKQCDGTGYSGRTGVFQIARVGSELRALATAAASEPEIEAKISELGAPTLHDQALKKVQAGLVSLQEVVRVLGGAT